MCPLSGIFFVLPCIESYQKVDLRTITLGVPPQEVNMYTSVPRNGKKKQVNMSNAVIPT